MCWCMQCFATQLNGRSCPTTPWVCKQLPVHGLAISRFAVGTFKSVAWTILVELTAQSVDNIDIILINEALVRQRFKSKTKDCCNDLSLKQYLVYSVLSFVVLYHYCSNFHRESKHFYLLPKSGQRTVESFEVWRAFPPFTIKSFIRGVSCVLFNRGTSPVPPMTHTSGDIFLRPL